MFVLPAKPRAVLMAGAAALALSGCVSGLDLDLRGGLGQSLDTSDAALNATAPRPDPDDRGIISYPNYQVVVAQRGDTVTDVANRIGMSPNELADYNAIRPDDSLRRGEILALPRRVAEPSEATGGSGQVIAPSNVDIAALAGNAINNATPSVETDTLEPASVVTEDTQVGYEPIRHTVERGETAFTISRLYNVSVRSLAEWNGLDKQFTIRENQILLIPPALPNEPEAPEPVASNETTQPGEGSPTPTPPSASKPLPRDDTAKVVEKPATPNLGQTQTATTSKAAMSYPVDGKIVRTYAKGKNNGIDLSAPAGTPIKAAAAGTVAAITKDADGVTIVVLRHPDNLMTVYYNVDDVSVTKGTAVTRGSTLAKIPSKNNFVHFEVRKGFDSVDPMPFLE